MNLKEYLISIGRLTDKPVNKVETQVEKLIVEQLHDSEQQALPELKTLEFIFDYNYRMGRKSLPKGIQINADNWKGNIIGYN